MNPSADDFMFVEKDQTITAPKRGAFVSDFFMCEIMAIDVGSSEYCKDIK